LTGSIAASGALVTSLDDDKAETMREPAALRLSKLIELHSEIAH